MNIETFPFNLMLVLGAVVIMMLFVVFIWFLARIIEYIYGRKLKRLEELEK